MIWTYYESGQAVRCASPEAQGMARLGNVSRRFFRGSKSWIPIPGTNQYTEIPIGCESLHASGLVFQRELTCYQPRNSFIAGLDGWTPTAGNGSIALDENEPHLWDGSVQSTRQTVAITGGAPVSPILVAPASLDLSGVENARFRVWRRDDSGVPLDVAVYSSKAAKFYNWTTRAFSEAAADWYALPVASATILEPWVKDITSGAPGAPHYLTLRFRQNTAGATSHLAYASWDEDNVSPGVTTNGIGLGGPLPCNTLTSPLVRERDELLLFKLDGIAAASAGTWAARVEAFEDLIVEQTVARIINRTTGDYLLLSGEPDRFTATAVIGGAPLESECLVAVTAGTYRLVVVYSGTTMCLYVNGTAGAPVTLPSALWAAGAPRYMLFPATTWGGATRPWPGAIGPFGTSPTVWTQARAASWGV